MKDTPRSDSTARKEECRTCAAQSTWIPLADIRLRDRGLDRTKIERYRAWLEDGREPPPVLLTRAGDTFYVDDGRHRISAARVAGHVPIEAEVRDA